VWGTIGWIVASWPFIFILVNWAKVPGIGEVGFIDWLGKALGDVKRGDRGVRGATVHLLGGRGVASFVLAAISPTLPHTPAEARPSGGDLVLRRSRRRKLLKKPVRRGSVPRHVHRLRAVHQSFFYWTASFFEDRRSYPRETGCRPVMKIGQIAEILTMLILGYVLKSLGLAHERWSSACWATGRGFNRVRVLPRAVGRGHGQCAARYLLRVLLRYRVHLRGRVLPQGTCASSAQGLFNVLILGRRAVRGET